MLALLTATDFLAIYGSLLATALAGWDVAKYVLERRRLSVYCYVAQIVTPGVGIEADNLLAYRIANTGGKPIVVTTLGGKLRRGNYFLNIRPSVPLPLTLQPGEAITATGPMPENMEDVTCFVVHDALGKEWKASTATVRERLAIRAAKRQSSSL